MAETNTVREAILRKTTREMVMQAVQTAWPAMLASFAVNVAGLIDSMMVSTLGKAAVAAVGLTSQPKFIFMTIFISMNIALSATIARRKGEDRRRDANTTLLSALTMTVALVIVLSAVAVGFADPIIRFAGSNADTHADAVLYFRIIMGGFLCNAVTMCINSAQRGSGYTRISMTTNLTSSIVNICFNYLLIGGHLGFPALGIRGAAIATVFGSFVATIMSIFSLFRKASYVQIPYMRALGLKPRFDELARLLRLASNFVVENVAMRVGFLATAMIAARLGTDAFAAHNVGMNLMSLAFSFADGLQAASVALSGEALGAGLPDHAKKYARICQRIGVGISLTLSLFFIFFGRWFFSLYFPGDEPVLAISVMICRFICVIVLLQLSLVVFMGTLRAAGDVRFTLTASMISVLGLRTGVTALCVYVFHLGIAGIWLGILADQRTRLLLATFRFRSGKWIGKKI